MDAVSSSRLPSRYSVGRDEWAQRESVGIVVDANGRPVFGADGLLIYVLSEKDHRIPEGGFVACGLILDHNGMPVLEADGSVIYSSVTRDERIPPGGMVASGIILDGNKQPLLGEDGKPIYATSTLDPRIPRHGTVATGVILDESGAPVLGADGQLLYVSTEFDQRVPRRGSIAAGLILDAEGKPVIDEDGSLLIASSAFDPRIPPGGSISEGIGTTKAMRGTLAPVDRRRAAFLAAVAESRAAAASVSRERKRAKAARRQRGRRKPPPPSDPIEVAAIAIQARLRGMLERVQVGRLRRGLDPRLSAIRIQRVVRGRAARARLRNKGLGFLLARRWCIGGAKMGRRQSHQLRKLLLAARPMSLQSDHPSDAPTALELALAALRLGIGTPPNVALPADPTQIDPMIVISQLTPDLIELLIAALTPLPCWDHDPDLLDEPPHAYTLPSHAQRGPLPHAAPMAKHDLPHAAPMAKHDLSNLFPQTFPLPEWLAALPTLRYSPNEIGALRERRLTHDARHASEHDQKVVRNGAYYVAQHSKEAKEQLLCRAWDVRLVKGEAYVRSFADAYDAAAQPTPSGAAAPTRVERTLRHAVDMVAVLSWNATDGYAVLKAETGPYALSPRASHRSSQRKTRASSSPDKIADKSSSRRRSNGSPPRRSAKA